MSLFSFENPVECNLDSLKSIKYGILYNTNMLFFLFISSIPELLSYRAPIHLALSIMGLNRLYKLIKHFNVY